MPNSRRLWCVLASAAVSGALAYADTTEPPQPVPQPSSWIVSFLELPVVRWLYSFDAPFLPVAEPQAAVPPAPLPPCWITPLAEVTDEQALAFERQTGPVVDVDGLTPRTSRALTRFESLVEARGGSVWLTSAYRPMAYQQHLRDVWYKWMYELKDNADPACADLRSQVGEEFTRHQLLPTQHPVAMSDHTLGIGFDAAVQLPAPAARRARRRLISVDRLARLAGMMRPDIRRDPVHFRLIGGRG